LVGFASGFSRAGRNAVQYVRQLVCEKMGMSLLVTFCFVADM